MTRCAGGSLVDNLRRLALGDAGAAAAGVAVPARLDALVAVALTGLDLGRAVVTGGDGLGVDAGGDRGGQDGEGREDDGGVLHGGLGGQKRLKRGRVRYLGEAGLMLSSVVLPASPSASQGQTVAIYTYKNNTRPLSTCRSSTMIFQKSPLRSSGRKMVPIPAAMVRQNLCIMPPSGSRRIFP